MDGVALVEEGVDGVWVACASCLFEVPFVLVELVLEAHHVVHILQIPVIAQMSRSRLGIRAPRIG